MGIPCLPLQTGTFVEKQTTADMIIHFKNTLSDHKYYVRFYGRCRFGDKNRMTMVEKSLNKHWWHSRENYPMTGV